MAMTKQSVSIAVYLLTVIPYRPRCMYVYMFMLCTNDQNDPSTPVEQLPRSL